jgi:ADP-heptose:LPS heptosyltransferase
LILKQLENLRVVVPEEITVTQWVDPRPQQIPLGRPVSDKNIEAVVEGANGELEIKAEYPTLVGNLQWKEHNNNIFNRINTLDPLSIKKIAVKRTIGMGDVLLTEPVIRALKRKYPNAAITFFAANGRNAKDIVQYFESKPDEIIGLENEQVLIQDILYNKKGYDLRFDLDLAYESRQNVNYIDAYFEITGFKEEVKEIDGELTIVPDVPEYEKVPRLKYDEPAIIQEKYVAVELAGSGWGGKEWDLGAWKLLLKQIPYKIVFTSGLRIFDNEAGSDQIIYINKNNKFSTMMNLIKHCEFFVGSDCGPAHIAVAFDKPAFIIAGAALPKYTMKSHLAFGVSLELDCLHCKGRQFVNQTNEGFSFVAKCENPSQYKCMSDLKLEYASNKLKEFLQKYEYLLDKK